MNSDQIIIRKLEKSNCLELEILLKEFANLEKVSGQMRTEAELIKSGFEENPPRFHCILAEISNYQNSGSAKIVGLALYYYRFSTLAGRWLYLEDLFVIEEFRHQFGVGTKFMKFLAKICVEENLSEMRNKAFAWNTKAQSFYTKNFGVKCDNQIIYKYDLESMKKFINDKE